jgi:hypothetical protein
VLGCGCAAGRVSFDGAGCAGCAAGVGVGFGLPSFGIFRPPGSCAGAVPQQKPARMTDASATKMCFLTLLFLSDWCGFPAAGYNSAAFGQPFLLSRRIRRERRAKTLTAAE